MTPATAAARNSAGCTGENLDHFFPRAGKDGGPHRDHVGPRLLFERQADLLSDHGNGGQVKMSIGGRRRAHANEGDLGSCDGLGR